MSKRKNEVVAPAPQTLVEMFKEVYSAENLNKTPPPKSYDELKDENLAMHQRICDLKEALIDSLEALKFLLTHNTMDAVQNAQQTVTEIEDAINGR